MSLYAVSQTKPVDGNLTYYHHLFDPALPPGNETTWVGFGLYAPNGTIVDQPLLVPYTSLRVPPTPINVSNVAQAFFSTLLSYVVPSWLSLGPTPLMGRIG